MDHVRIFANLANLLLGLAVLFQVRQAYLSHGLALLKSIGFYVACFNAMVMLNLVAQYTTTNLFAGNELAVPIWIIAPLLVLLLAAELGSAYWLHRASRELVGATVSTAVKGVFVAWAVAFAVAHAVGLVQAAASRSITLVYWVHAAWLATMLVIIMASLIACLLEQLGPAWSVAGRSAHAFAALYLAGYSVYLVEELCFYFSEVRLDQLDLPLLLLNLCAPAWLYFFFRPTSASERQLRDHALLEQIAGERGISERETEVIAQLLLGKSNREIADSLFISESTVKNHLYSIYRKLEVSSRAQLLALFTANGAAPGSMGG